MVVTSSDHMQNHIAGWLSPREFYVLEILCDTFLPALDPPPHSSPTLTAYYQRRSSDLHIPLLIADTLATEDEVTRTAFRRLLGLLMTPLSSLLLIGKGKAFVDLSFPLREKYLLAMAQSLLPDLRQGYQAIKRLCCFLFFTTTGPDEVNPNWSAIDYTPAPPPQPSPPRPLQPLAITHDTILECDAVVIGSGAGGGVVAGELAVAGKNVIVLEQGDYYADGDFTLQEARSMSELYLKRGMLSSKDLGIMILAGRTLGGGTVVNWDTSFRTPDPILTEWAQLSGLPLFTQSALQDSFAAVEQGIRVNTENSAHNRQNQLLFDGARTLGYHADSLRRNAVGCKQRCGTCGFGCRYGCKQSTTKTYLQNAYDHGTRLIVGCHADTVLIEQGQAVGVTGKVTDTQTGEHYQLTVRARAVIVAAGSINSPTLLLRSGLTNKHIGQHLHLHPTTTISGTYTDTVYSWQGVMQSAYSDEFGYLTENYGYKLEVPPAHPGMFAMANPWFSARDYRETMLRAAHTATLIILTRDKGEGKITLDPHGEPVIQYALSAFDRRHVLHGLRHAARIHMAAGAIEIISLQNKRTHLQREKDAPVSQRIWHDFDQRLEHNGLRTNQIMLYSAHQMGSCRMGASPEQSVVDNHCQVHGVAGLFVCDASVFPSASGVNPMLSIMALAHLSSQYIKTTL